MLNNYSKYSDKMILRDQLALDRTVLANERTLLSYIRTFIGLVAAGVGIVKLFDGSDIYTVFGYLFIVVSPIFLVAGIRRYLRIHSKLMTLDDKTGAQRDN